MNYCLLEKDLVFCYYLWHIFNPLVIILTTEVAVAAVVEAAFPIVAVVAIIAVAVEVIAAIAVVAVYFEQPNPTNVVWCQPPWHSLELIHWDNMQLHFLAAAPQAW